MRNRSLNLSVCSALLLLFGCGKGVVKVTNESYEPRIVVSGLLVAGQPVENIHISRNFRLDTNLNETPILLPDADVVLIDEDEEARFPLTFVDSVRFGNADFDYLGDDLVIRTGGTYSLEVRAMVEGEELFASATTTVPVEGFEIVDISPARLQYRQRDEAGDVILPELTIERSPGTTFYLLTAIPLNFSVDSFVYDNPFDHENPETIDLFDYDYEWEWIQNTPKTAGQSKMGLFWWDLWFYGRHEIVVYASDPNWATSCRLSTSCRSWMAISMKGCSNSRGPASAISVPPSPTQCTSRSLETNDRAPYLMPFTWAQVVEVMAVRSVPRAKT